MIRLEVAPGSFLDGAAIGMLQQENDMDIVLHGPNEGEVQVHPASDVLVQAGDTLVIFARHSKITDVVARNQRRRLQSV